MRAWQILTVLLAGLLGSQPAFAAKASSLDKQAMKACLSGDYQKGVSILADLFVETGDATYLWNQGRCYEQNHRYEDAIALPPGPAHCKFPTSLVSFGIHHKPLNQLKELGINNAGA